MPAPLQAILQTLLQQGDLLAGKYRIGPVIGSGGVATVYRATHVWTEREVAVKVLDSSVPHFELLRHAFLREARATVQLSHPNVVDVLDMGEEDWATAYMVMELLEGPTLRDVLLERGRLSETETLAILMPLIDALEKAHALGIIHRDVKPENVMLVEDSRGFVAPKLIDFGVAEVLQDLRRESLQSEDRVIMGTPQYMAPEQAQDQRERIGPHTDVWGVAVVWYECLTGIAPFDGETSLDILEAVCRAPIDFTQIPEGHSAILGEMFDRSTERRIGSLGMLKTRIENSGIELPSIPPPEPVSSSWRPTGHERTGVHPTMAGVRAKRLVSAPPSPPEVPVDSELLNVPIRSQRGAALAGLVLTLMVVLAAWWTVRGEGAGGEAFVVPDSVFETVVEPVLEPDPVPEPVAVFEDGPMSEPEPETVADADTDAAADTAAVADPAADADADADTDADAVADPDAVAAGDTARDGESAEASAPKVERKAKARRKVPAKRRPAANDTKELEPEGTPGLVTEW